MICLILMALICSKLNFQNLDSFLHQYFVDVVQGNTISESKSFKKLRIDKKAELQEIFGPFLFDYELVSDSGNYINRNSRMFGGEVQNIFAVTCDGATVTAISFLVLSDKWFIENAVSVFGNYESFCIF